MLNFMHSFYMLGFIQILFRSEWYSLLVVIHVVLFGSIRIFWYGTTFNNHHVEITMCEDLGFSDNGTSKVIGALS